MDKFNRWLYLFFLFLFIYFSTLSTGLYAQSYTLLSPSKKIVLSIRSAKRVTYALSFNGRSVLNNSSLGFQFDGAPPLGGDLSITDSVKVSRNETWIPVVKGRHSEIRDHYNELHLYLTEKIYPARHVELFFRAYDDGIAFRYLLHPRAGQAGNTIVKELTGFSFNDDHTAWMADYGTFTSSQETEFFPHSLSYIKEQSIIGLPLLVKVSDTCFAAITEANITDWPGFYISRAEKDHSLGIKLAPLPGQPENGLKVKMNADHFSPWRVVLLASEPGKLIESEMIQNLNAPAALKDVSWIIPGKCSWDHWWSGEVQMDTRTIKKYIQSASDLGFPYMLIDWQWYGPFNNPAADITHVNPAVDMPEVLRFAKEKNVKCWLWLYNTDADRQYKEAFALYEKWGIAGIKIDFMNSDDQEMVNWYHKIIKSAADHHLMINFHGAYKPDGFQRTYPNLMTREGVMGNEYSKWSTRITPEHNVTLPFTRMLAGPMDYTPGGFLNRSPEKFRNGTPANVMNTRCQQLAMFVIYESPVTTVCDDPDHYAGQPGIDFLKAVPTTWDDTKVLMGYPGEYICIARRSGTRWFLGAMNNSNDRIIEVPLDFLGKGRSAGRLFEDGPDADLNAEHLIQSSGSFSAGQHLKIKMARGGGFAAWFDTSSDRP